MFFISMHTGILPLVSINFCIEENRYYRCGTKDPEEVISKVEDFAEEAFKTNETLILFHSQLRGILSFYNQ